MTAFYFRNERLILGLSAGAFVLLFWEGLARGWWADMLAPVIGAAADRLRPRAIFVSSPTAIAVTADRKSTCLNSSHT